MPDHDLRPEHQRQRREPGEPDDDEVALGQHQRERQVRELDIERLVAGMARLVPAERKRQGRHRPPPARQAQHARIAVRREHQREVVQAHLEPVGVRDPERPVKQPVGRVERRHVALGHERRTYAEPVAPERQGPPAQGPRQLRLDRPVEVVGVAVDRLVPDEQAAQRQRHDCQCCQQRGAIVRGFCVHHSDPAGFKPRPTATRRSDPLGRLVQRGFAERS
jgi:hypothetical protein